jgi:hypothetical protein
LKRILHIAPQNFAGMPYDFVKMQRHYGFDANLITLYRNTLNFEEDICLNLRLNTGNLSKKWRDEKVRKHDSRILKIAKPKNIFEMAYFRLRDFKNHRLIEKQIENRKLYDYDIYHFDGGMDLYRNCKFAKQLKYSGKKIVCCYFGSDLRSRGIFEELDKISDLNLTVEFDHLNLHPKINYIPFAFDVDEFEFTQRKPATGALKIIHTPTNRLFKGTDKIIRVIEEVKKTENIEFILLENADLKTVLGQKKISDIAIDQVGGEFGGTGYGRNSIENLSFGLPTITEFSADYLNFIEDNPFITADIDNLKSIITNLSRNRELISDYSLKGRIWAENFHSYNSVNKKLLEFYKSYNMI